MTNAVVPLILRRMRTPLLVLISAYAIAIVGLTLMPGETPDGNPWRMDFFHAFYVITYTAPTIGFGEIPYEFTGAQRLWVTFSIYLTVLSWLYAVGTIIALIQDPSFRGAVKRGRLRRAVRQMAEPFYIVCGYGDTGGLLVRALTERGRRVVVVDRNESAIHNLELRDLKVHVPGFHLDAELPENLDAAGLRHRWCAGIIAVTDSDHANLKVALTSKLLNPGMTVVARSQTAAGAANIASFGTDSVVNAYDGFADRLVLAMQAPEMHRVLDWLTGIPATQLRERPQPPQGTWIICGYGRLGRAVYRELARQGIQTVLVDEDPIGNGCPPGTIPGKGTEAHTLRTAGIDRASALLAGTDDDADNLSIVMTARQINDTIYLAARENELASKALYQEAGIDLLVEPSYILASRILSVLNAPLLEDFLAQARTQDRDWQHHLMENIRTVAHGTTPETWTLRISRNRAPAVLRALEREQPVSLAGVTHHPRDRQRSLDCIALALVREGDMTLLPGPETELASGDRILFCGSDQALGLMRVPLQHDRNLHYMLTGESHPDSGIWRFIARRHAQDRPAPTPPR